MLCLGLAYKPDTDDLRESPAVEVVRGLAEAGLCHVLVAEPNLAALPERLEAGGVRWASSLANGLAQADFVVLLVAHKEFRDLDGSLLQGKEVHDATGVWATRSR